MWIEHEDYKKIISKAWNNLYSSSIAYQFIRKLNETRKALTTQDKNYFGQLQKVITKLENKMERKQNQDEYWANIKDIGQIKKNLELYLHYLEMDLAQKALINYDLSMEIKAPSIFIWFFTKKGLRLIYML